VKVEVNSTEFLCEVHKACHLTQQQSFILSSRQQAQFLPSRHIYIYDTMFELATFSGRQRIYQTLVSLGKSNEFLENLKIQSNPSQNQYFKISFISIMLWHWWCKMNLALHKQLFS